MKALMLSYLMANPLFSDMIDSIGSVIIRSSGWNADFNAMRKARLGVTLYRWSTARELNL
ncbi:MAG: hypothetical protein COB04_09070 [Gammaproteobacteria bacterium]|nr:MAG: hypothetical protein COB04_09070 [Gammaproteobacteria bacterium]